MPDIIKQTKNYNIVIYSDYYNENNNNYLLMIVDNLKNGERHIRYLQINYNKLYKILNIILEYEKIVKYLLSFPLVITQADLECINLWQTIN